MSVKVDVRPILRGQWATFRGYSVTTRLTDAAIFAGLPLIGGYAAGRWGPNVVNVGAILAGVGVFTALLFGLLVNVLNLSIKLRRDEDLPIANRVVKNVGELFTNVAWSVLVGLVLVVALIAAASTHKPEDALSPWWVGILTTLLLHLIVIVVQALLRLWYAHDAIGHLPVRRTHDSAAG